MCSPYPVHLMLSPLLWEADLGKQAPSTLIQGTHPGISQHTFVHTCCFSHVQLFVTLWTVACQTPLSMGFSSKNTGVGCHALLQRRAHSKPQNLKLIDTWNSYFKKSDLKSTQKDIGSSQHHLFLRYSWSDCFEQELRIETVLPGFPSYQPLSTHIHLTRG